MLIQRLMNLLKRKPKPKLVLRPVNSAAIRASLNAARDDFELEAARTTMAALDHLEVGETARANQEAVTIKARKIQEKRVMDNHYLEDTIGRMLKGIHQ